MNPIETLSQKEVQDFMAQHAHTDAAQLMLLAHRYPGLPMALIAAQLQGKQKAKTKLPGWFTTPGIVYPPLLSMEQCSSELTAAFKATLFKGNKVADLTGGFGVDLWAFSKQFSEAWYVERNPALCPLAAHNFDRLQAHNITIQNAEADAFLRNTTGHFDLIFLDPARRDTINKKIAQLEDCEPNVLELLPLLLQKANKVLLKTAPMLDIQQAMRALKLVEQVWVVATQGECKEVLYLIGPAGNEQPQIHAIELSKSTDPVLFSFYSQTEASATAPLHSPLTYLYEPNAALLKAGAFKLLALEFGVYKLHPHSHLYTAANLVKNFPGRKFKILHQCRYDKKEVQKVLPNKKANITTRNFPATVAEIRKKTGIKEGGDDYVFATTDISSKPVMLICQKIS